MNDYSEGKRLITALINFRPGFTQSELRDVLDMDAVVLRTILDSLEAEGLIGHWNDGKDIHYLCQVRENGEMFQDKSKQIMDYISLNPGVTQKEMAEYFDTSRKVIYYHIDKLKNEHRIMIKKEGRRNLHFPAGSNGDVW